MTIEGIIRMAKQAGFADEEIDTCQQILIHFAELVARAEREAVLDLIDGYAKNNTDLAEAIRARGQA